MKKPVLSVVFSAFLFFAGLPAHAQLASDPNDRMYTDLKLWEDRGLLQNLPPMRPYPIQLLKKLLTQVEDKGDEADIGRAREYFAAMDGVVNIHVGVGTELRTDLKSVYGAFTFGGPFQGSLDPLVTWSGYLAGVGNNGPADSLLPAYQRSLVDYIFDPAVKPLGTTSFIPRVSSATAATLGTDTFYLQAGDIRGSWGPFWGENVVLSPSAAQTGQFSYVYRGENFTITESILAISAVQSDGTGGPFPDKFVALHGMELYPLPWLTLSIFESVVWGGRFELLYMLPFAVHYYTQGFAGFPDNSFIGISGGIKLPHAVRVDFIAYFDDMSFNDIIKLDFNTKMKFAFQTGVSWTPNLPYLARIELNAMMVTPYTYTHADSSVPGAPNFLDYTNVGQNMGPSLQPDSARFELKALLRPYPFLDVSPFTRLIFHGNASTNANPFYVGTGTIFDNGDATNAYNTFRFLDQAVIETTIQAGFGSKAYLTTPIGKVQLSLDYTFEYVQNKDSGTGPVSGANGMNNYLGVGFAYSY